jgi:hypothetical protein
MEISLRTYLCGGGFFFSASWIIFKAVRTASWTAFRAVRTDAILYGLMDQIKVNIKPNFLAISPDIPGSIQKHL